MFARSLAQTLQRCRSLTAAVGPATVLRGAPAAVALPTCRSAHTDLAVPDFSAYRNSHTEKPNELSSGGEMGKRAAAYMVLGGTSISIWCTPPPSQRLRKLDHRLGSVFHHHRWAGGRNGSD